MDPMVPSPPRTPSPRAQRLLFRYQAGQWVMLGVGGGLLLFGVVFTLAFGWGSQADLLIAFSHENVLGHVIGTRIDRNTVINGEHPTLIRFRYPAGDGELIGESSTRDPDRIHAAVAGAEVPVELYPGHPHWARIAGTDYAWLGVWGLSFAVLPAAALVLIFLAVRGRGRRIRAFTDGRSIQARVTFADYDRTTRINGRHPLLLRWEFNTEGEVFTGSISSLDPELLGDLMKQQEITVLYDPMNPRINTVFVA